MHKDPSLLSLLAFDLWCAYIVFRKRHMLPGPWWLPWICLLAWIAFIDLFVVALQVVTNIL
jgi:hypothetical protein